MIDRCENLLELFENYISVSGDAIIYLRENLTNSEIDYNAGKAGGTKIIDLNGNTITINTASFYYGQAKNNNAAKVTFKNGTIDPNGKIFWFIGCDREKAAAKKIEAIFDSITFTNVKKALIAPGSSTYTFQGNFTFNNCTIEASPTLETNLFLSSYPTNATINVQVNGGDIILDNHTADILSFPTDAATHSISYGEYQGKYTTVSLANTVSTDEFVVFTEDGAPLGLYKTDSTADSTVYTLSPLAIVKAFLNITNDLNLVYRVYLPAGYENPTATFTVGEHVIEVSEYTVDENGLYLFKLTAIGPHRMGDTVTATVSATYNGKTATVTNNTLSVKSYADMIRAQNADNAELIALLDALLVYGANAQVYMGHNTDSLVAELGELAEIPEGTIEKNGTTNTDYSIVSAGLRLGGAFDFGVQIKVADLTGLTLKITKGGVEKTVTLTEDMKVGEYYVVYYNGLIASELDESVTFTLLQNGEQIGKSLTLTANAYLAALQTSENAKLASLTKALYAYGVAANAFAG